LIIEVNMAEPWQWWRDGVIYQIYPRSFMDSNGDGIGDLNGITGKLDYLADLGVDGLWLSPIFPSPDKDFGYDVADYCGIDPKYGTMADFDRLVSEARKRRIHIILDLVLNHTSDQHPWFIESKKSRDNPHHDWYLWREPKAGKKPPNNWLSIFGGQGWEYIPELGESYFHMFVKEQPDVNWRNPDLRKAMLDVFRFWLARGVDGFRLDVFNAYFKDEQFRDNPPSGKGMRGFDRQKHLYDTSQPELYPLLREIRAILDEKPDTYVVGETFLENEKKAASYCASGLLHQAFDFRLLECKWDARRFQQVIQSWENALSEGSWPNYVLGNHDTRHPATRLGRGENDERLKVINAMLFTLRGTPFLYYGDEIGMRDISLARKELQDPVGVRYWPLPVGRDGCRSPMQWTAEEFAGFTTTTPWLKVHPNHETRNLTAQEFDPDSLYNFTRKLIHLRRENEALRRGMYMPLIYYPRSLMIYLRKTEGQSVLVALNFTRRRVPFVFGHGLALREWELLLSNRRAEITLSGGDTLTLEPEEAVLLRMK
jgi:alpha-glucosidase